MRFLSRVSSYRTVAIGTVSGTVDVCSSGPTHRVFVKHWGCMRVGGRERERYFNKYIKKSILSRHQTHQSSTSTVPTHQTYKKHYPTMANTRTISNTSLMSSAKHINHSHTIRPNHGKHKNHMKHITHVKCQAHQPFTHQTYPTHQTPIMGQKHQARQKPPDPSAVSGVSPPRRRCPICSRLSTLALLTMRSMSKDARCKYHNTAVSAYRLIG